MAVQRWSFVVVVVLRELLELRGTWIILSSTVKAVKGMQSLLSFLQLNDSVRLVWRHRFSLLSLRYYSLCESAIVNTCNTDSIPTVV